TYGIDGFTQSRLSDGKRARLVEHRQASPIEPIKVPNAAQPTHGPLLVLLPTLAHLHEVAPLMSPAKGQFQFAFLDLLHGLIRGQAVDHEDAFGIVGVVPLWDIVAAVR